jgi:phosphonoacetaldehyde hydrolase
MRIKAILFDLIGTTVSEANSNTIHRCFLDAFAANGICVSDGMIRQHRGKDKIEMINAILSEAGNPGTHSKSIYMAFHNSVQKSIGNFTEADGARATFTALRSKGIKIGLGTGLERSLLERIMSKVEWPVDWFDYIGVGPELARQRPYPDMIIAMQNKLNVARHEFLKVGDTVADIQEGKDAMVKTVAIVSGTQPEALLRDAGPDFVITHLTEINTLVGINDW